MLDIRLIEKIAGALSTDEGLIEKDWHVVRAIGIISLIDQGIAKPVFSGGTSLSKGWNLIKRFSEDINFKVEMPQSSNRTENRNKRRAFREHVLSTLTANGFELMGKPLSGDESRFFSADLSYPSYFTTGIGLRPHIKVEMSFHNPALKPIKRPIQSIISVAQKKEPEVPCFPCIDPVETAADKLSALAWRVCTRRRGSDEDDPTVVRHLYDLATLEKHIKDINQFVELTAKTMKTDTKRGGSDIPVNLADRFEMMFNLLRTDGLWETEYENFVRYVSFGKTEERIDFSEALLHTAKLVNLTLKKI